MFRGFPSEGLSFLGALKRNNNREWFQPRKEIFESKVRGPMLELVNAINGELAKFAPDYITDPKKAVYRIYRDTRFSADKTPYKTHIAAGFPRGGKGKGPVPGYFFSIGPKEIGIAGGIYELTPEMTLAIRTWLAGNHEAFRKIARGPVKLMGELHGESLTRAPKGFPADHPALDLIKMKRWLYYKTLDADLAKSSKITGELVKRFKLMLPMMEQLHRALASAKRFGGSLLW
jgi:uncharacterized protein (TIGR02453 family)